VSGWYRINSVLRFCLKVDSDVGIVTAVERHRGACVGLSVYLIDLCVCFSDQPDVMLILLQAGADVNALNMSQCSALHIAINKQHVHCVRVLLQYNCDVNVQV